MDNKSENKSTIYSIFLAIVITSVVAGNFLFNYEVSYSLLLLLLLLFVVVLGDKYKEISIGKIKLLKDEIVLKDGEIKNLRELLKIENTQNQTIVNNIHSNLNGLTENVPNVEEQIDKEENEKKEVIEEYRERKIYDRKKVADFVLKKLRDEYGFTGYETTENVQINLKQICDMPTRFDYRVNKENQIILIDVRQNNLGVGVLYKEQLYKKIVEVQHLRETPLKPNIHFVVAFYSTPERKSNYASEIIEKIYQRAIDEGLLVLYKYDITEADEKKYNLLKKDRLINKNK